MKTLEDFKRLIRTTQMSHIYKPVMLQAVLKRGGKASKAEIAADIIQRDGLQQEHYRRNIIDRQPGVRLVRDGALKRDGENYSLASPFDQLAESDRLELIAECERRIEEFIERHGDRFGSPNSDPVPGSLAYEVRKRSGGRCELCGVSHEEVALEVDHIVPRSIGGSNDLSNLQALCRTCNAEKGNRDDTDFRTITASFEHREPDCIFCQKETGDDPLAFVVDDGFPVTEGHSLIIPRRHVASYFDLHQSERNAMERLMHKRREELLAGDPSIAGFNVGINAGEAAGQTVFHVHIHLIPRRHGDVDDPQGGVRAVIPEKQRY
jgi:ATP adenylyltransferase